MRAKPKPTDVILRELLERLTAAREMTDVVIAAGIALNELDGVEENEGA